MASPTRTLTVNFVGRTKNLEKSFKRVSKGSATMSDNVMRATRMAGVGFAALGGVVIGAAAALKPMIDKAAAMEEALSKNQLLLGESSKAVEQFAETSLQSFGVSNLAALQATGVFANLGKAMKMSEADSASMAITLTGLAGDLSSLHDVSVETALTALRAGLIGEAEPLRKFGIFLDAATLKNKALEMGLIKNTKEALTPAIKSTAAYALILQEGANAMGDFTRTADSATNVSKKLAGQWEELQVLIGTALLPAFTAFVTHLSEEIMPALEEFFEDPSWEAFGELAGDAASSGFVREFAFGVAKGLEFFNPWSPKSWKFWLEAILANDEAENAGIEIADAMTGGFEAAIEQFGRDNPDWYRGDWDPEASGTADGLAYGAAFAFAVSDADAAMRLEMQEALEAGIAAAAGRGGGGGTMDPGERAAAAAADAAAAFSPEPMIPGPLIPPPPPPSGHGMDPGQRLAAVSPTTGLSGFEAMAMLSDPAADLSRFLPTGGTSSTTVNNHFNITGVSPSEVMDAIGAAVDLTGPMPPHWQQSAN